MISSGAMAKDLEALEREYRRKRTEIRADPSLSWEKKELKIKALGDEYYAQRRLMYELHNAIREDRVVGRVHVENTTTNGSVELNLKEEA